MFLSVMERLMILQILPKESDFITLKILRSLKDVVGFGEEEHREYKFTAGDGGVVRWDADAVQEKELLIGEKAHDIVAEALKRLNDQKKLTEAHMSLYEKFMGD